MFGVTRYHSMGVCDTREHTPLSTVQHRNRTESEPGCVRRGTWRTVRNMEDRAYLDKYTVQSAFTSAVEHVVSDALHFECALQYDDLARGGQRRARDGHSSLLAPRAASRVHRFLREGELIREVSLYPDSVRIHNE